MNGRDAQGDQLELTPRIGLSEPLQRPEDAAELLSVKLSWIYEALPASAGSRSYAWGSISASRARSWSGGLLSSGIRGLFREAEGAPAA